MRGEIVEFGPKNYLNQAYMGGHDIRNEEPFPKWGHMHNFGI
jgi:ligand-binding SRPBCC domain-containing protein